MNERKNHHDNLAKAAKQRKARTGAIDHSKHYLASIVIVGFILYIYLHIPTVHRLRRVALSANFQLYKCPVVTQNKVIR